VALLAWAFLKERITRRHLIALALAYAGVMLLFGPEIGSQGPDALLGGGLIFASALIYACYVLASKPVIAAMGSALFTAFAMTAASAAFLVMSGIEWTMTAPQPISARGLWLTFWLAMVCTVAPSFMIAEATARIGPGPMSAIGGVRPVSAAWGAVMILHEPFGWPHVAAMALTVCGVWLLARPPARAPVEGRA
jgi:drug/metabolite transporter (DMT)-like permease